MLPRDLAARRAECDALRCGISPRRKTILDIDQRIADLLGRMTLAEKAGMLFQTMIAVGSGDLSEPNSAFRTKSAEHMIKEQRLTHFNVIRATDDARTSPISLGRSIWR
jgi:hypothetical protein